ncbi:MAG: EAL domain-containing protein [Planctomycetales bacterium]|nr:EAL domain-containing protein [Planctomycetales bacterium]
MQETKSDSANSLGISLDASVWFFAGQLDESEPVRHVRIHTLPFRIGRKSDLALALPCNCVSKEHAEIFERDGAIWVRDLGSTNGTYVNGVRVDTEYPIGEGDLVQFATMVFRVGREEQTADSFTIQEDTCDRALAMIQFDRLINDGGVVPFYQPIVEMQNRTTIGYEVLGRSRLFGLNTPAEMFSAASQLNLEAELSRVFRRRGVDDARPLPPGMNLFVNTHPVELAQPGLPDSLRDIREMCPDQLLTLEIHEAAIADPQVILQLRDVLNELNIRLAFDDFGAGQARLVELGEVLPHYIKFDMSLVRNIHKAPREKQQVVSTLISMVNNLGVASLAEGIECEESHNMLRDMGMQLGQGYFYGKPASISKWVKKENDA